MRKTNKHTRLVVWYVENADNVYGTRTKRLSVGNKSVLGWAIGI